MAQISAFCDQRIQRQAKDLHYQGYPDTFIIDSFLISPATFYRYKSGWKRPLVRVGIQDYLRAPKQTYLSQSLQKDPNHYDIVYAQKLALELNVGIQFVFKRFDRLLKGLAEGEYDMAMGLLAETNQRKKLVHFSDSYLEKSGDNACLVYNSKMARVRSHQDLFQKRIGVLRESAIEEFLQTLEIPMQIRAYDRYETCVIALQRNWVDGFVAPEPTARFFAQRSFPFPVEILPLGFSNKTAIAVNRENEDWVEKINLGIRRLNASGFTHQQSQVHFS